MDPAVTVAVLCGAQWRGSYSTSTTFHFLVKPAFCSWGGREDSDPWALVTFAMYLSSSEAGSLLDPSSEQNRDLVSTQRGKGSLNPGSCATAQDQWDPPRCLISPWHLLCKFICVHIYGTPNALSLYCNKILHFCKTLLRILGGPIQFFSLLV